MTSHEADDFMNAVLARRQEAGLRVDRVVNDGSGPRIFTAYAKDAKQAANWRAAWAADGSLIADAAK